MAVIGEKPLPWFNLLGIKINPLSHAEALAQMGAWINGRAANQRIVLANTHVVMESRENPILGEAITGASLVLPDGMPLVIVSRWRGFNLRKRADGPGLMAMALSHEPYKSWRHYFYGSTPEVLTALKGRYPGTNIVGDYSPPFRNLTSDEDTQIAAMINTAKPDILWVGLGCPKQELWMFTHHNRLNIPVMVGIGQAFDILAGVKPRAPQWMQNAGLEWLYRLIREPRRLWKRYLLYNPWFIWLVFVEQISLLLKGRLN